MKMDYVMRRGETYYVVIPIPERNRAKFGGAKQKWTSLKTKNKFEAATRAGALIQKYKKMYMSDDDTAYSDVAAVSERYETPYSFHAERSQGDVVDQINALIPQLKMYEPISIPAPIETKAAGGATPVAAMTMTQAFRRFKELSPDSGDGDTEVIRHRKWRRYERAAEDFEKIMGKIDVTKLTPADGVKYRAALYEMVVAGKFKSDSANKKMSWIKIILNTVLSIDSPDSINPFDRIKRINRDDAGKRPPFTEDEIRRIWTHFDEMDPVMRALMKIAANTGTGASELIWMKPEQIHLNAPIPYISIRPNDLRSKVKKGGDRHRDIPLVGEALDAMREFPGGFPDYWDERGPTRINGKMSDFFMKVIPGKSFYSFRHRMDDLLKNSGVDIGQKSAVTGHSLKGHALYYGEGYNLKIKKEAVEKALEYAKILD